MSIGTILTSLGAGLPVLLAVFTGWGFVNQGSMGLRVRFGSAFDKHGRIRVVSPGWVWLIPLADKIQQIHVQIRRIYTEPQDIWVHNQGFCTTTGFLTYRIANERALYFAICDLESDIDRWVQARFSALLGKHIPGLHLPQAELENCLFWIAHNDLSCYGLEVMEVRLPKFSPTYATQAAILFPPAASPTIALGPTDQPASTNGNSAHAAHA
ncbi:MAG TPA: SPFH domain-containing protein [Candidatus Saccharimonadia bacterium]|nr:SPFH domain-containing protein [Candidatus Saccharimonadia bacterium]